MDKLGVQHNGISKPPVHHHGGKGGGGKGKGGGSKQGIKVVYISSPMKLNASAEEFRAVVQELTGRDSNVAEHDAGGVDPSSSSSSSYSYSSSFGRASPTTRTTRTTGAAAAAGGRALPPAMLTANPGAGLPAEYAAGGAVPPPFQSMYDQTRSAGFLYGQDYW